MAITVTSAVRSPDGTLTITGTEFTKTTTTVSIDGETQTFECPSADTITVADVPDDAAEVTVEKGGVTETADITDEGEGDEPAAAAPAPGDDPQTGEGTPAGQYDPEPAPGTVDPQSPQSPGGIPQAQNPNQSSQQSFASGTFTTLAGDEIAMAFVPSGMEVAPQAIAPGTWPSPIDGFRAAVAGVALVGLIPVGDEKTPYPTGASLAAGKHFWLQQGYYKSATPT